jgi:hypothetical protein
MATKKQQTIKPADTKIKFNRVSMYDAAEVESLVEDHFEELKEAK